MLAFLQFSDRAGAEPLLALSELWIVLIIMAASAIFNWIKNRGKSDDWSDVESPPHQPRRNAPPRNPAHEQQPKKLSSWEEELRRMLDMDEEPKAPPRPSPTRTASPPAPPAPPPIVVRETRPRPAPVRTPPPPVISPAVPQERPMFRPVEVPAHKPLFSEATSGYQRAAHLHETVAAHLQHAAHSAAIPAIATLQRRKTRPLEAERVIHMLHNPQTARQAIIASVILAPPKGLEV